MISQSTFIIGLIASAIITGLFFLFIIIPSLERKNIKYYNFVIQVGNLIESFSNIATEEELEGSLYLLKNLLIIFHTLESEIEKDS